jgi:hypothetical protein
MPVRPTTRNVAGVSGLTGKPVVIWAEQGALGDLHLWDSELAADLRDHRQHAEIERGAAWWVAEAALRQNRDARAALTRPRARKGE